MNMGNNTQSITNDNENNHLTCYIDSLSQQLAAILENLEQMQQKEKPYLLALYQTSLGELETKRRQS